MAVASTYFIIVPPNVEPSIVHPKKNDLNPKALVLCNAAKKYYNLMVGSTNNTAVQLLPVLPSLVTSTNKVTVFVTPSKVHCQDIKYLVSRPKGTKHEVSDSSSRNNYTNRENGDTHCRGIHIVINFTFSAGGIAAPLFVTIYGLTADEILADDMVCVECPGLFMGSNQGVYSYGKGYVVFLLGTYSLLAKC